MQLDTKSVHGARYYTVAPTCGWNLQFEKWCIATFGKPGSVWDVELGRWYVNNAEFWFRKESDRTLFLLKFSN